MRQEMLELREKKKNETITEEETIRLEELEKYFNSLLEEELKKL
jgi:hypothetical protein